MCNVKSSWIIDKVGEIGGEFTVTVSYGVPYYLVEPVVGLVSWTGISFIDVTRHQMGQALARWLYTFLGSSYFDGAYHVFQVDLNMAGGRTRPTFFHSCFYFLLNFCNRKAVPWVLTYIDRSHWTKTAPFPLSIWRSIRPLSHIELFCRHLICRAFEDGDSSPPCMADVFRCMGKAARAALCAIARHLRLRSE